MTFLNRIEASNCVKYPAKQPNTNQTYKLDNQNILVTFGKWKVIGKSIVDFNKGWAVKRLLGECHYKRPKPEVQKQVERMPGLNIPYSMFRENYENFLDRSRHIVNISKHNPDGIDEVNDKELQEYSFEYRFIHFPLQALIVRHLLDQTHKFESIENILRPFEWDQKKNAYSNPDLYNQTMSKFKKQSIIDAMAYCRHFFSLRFDRRYDEVKDKTIFSVLSHLKDQAKEENLFNEFLTLICDLSLYDFFKNVTKELFNVISDEEAEWTHFVRGCLEKPENLKLLFGKRPEILESLSILFAQKPYAKNQLLNNITLFNSFLEVMSINIFLKFIREAADNCLPENAAKHLPIKSKHVSSIDYFKILLMNGLNLKICLDKMLPEFNEHITQLTFIFYEGLTRADNNVIDKLQLISNENKINKRETKRKRFRENNSPFFHNHNNNNNYTPMDESFDAGTYKDNGSKYVEKDSTYTQNIEFTQTVPFNEIEFFEYIVQKYNQTNGQERDRLFFVQYKEEFIQFLYDRKFIKKDSTIIQRINTLFRSSDSMKEDKQEQTSSQMQELINTVNILVKQNIMLMEQCQENTKQINQLLKRQKELENQVSVLCHSNDAMRLV